MKSGLKNSARVILFLAIGMVLLWLSFRGIDLKKLGSSLREAEYAWLLLSAAVSVIAFFLRARRWMLLIEPLGFTPGLINTYHSLVTGYFANLIFPRLGEITRCAALGKKEKLPFDKLVGTVIIERTIDLLTVLLLLGLTLIGDSATTGRFLSDNVITPLNERLTLIIGSSALIYIIIVGLMATGLFLAVSLRKKLSARPLFGKLYAFFDGIIEGLKSIAGLKKKWEFIMLTVLLWSAYLLMVYLPFLCLESTSHLGFGGAMFILVIGSFGMAVPVQSGMGAFHWIVSRGLLIVYGIPLEEGLAYATLSHESQLLIVTLFGLTSLFSLFGRHSGRILSPSVTEKGA